MKIAIVGAGIAGLTCAYDLQRSGNDVVVFESESIVGGRMATRTRNGQPFDIGANHLANVYTNMRALCAELGIEWRPMDFERYVIVCDGKIRLLRDVPSRFETTRLAWAYWRNKRIARDTYDFFDLSTLAELDGRRSANHIMQRRIGKHLMNYFVDSFVSSYQFHRGTEMSRSSMEGIMQSIQQHGPDWKLHRLPKGMSELPEALAQQLHVRLSTPVTRVEPRGNGVMVEAAGEQQEYDAAVLATPAPISANIYPSATAAQKDILNTTTYATTVSIAYTLPAGTMPKDQSIFWVPYTENPHISSYTNEMMKGIPMTCVWLHEEYAKQIIGKSDEEIYRLVAQEMPRVADWLPSPDVLKPYDIQRWPLAMPKFAPGSIARVAKFVTSPEQGAQNVFLCGDYLNAPWTEGALRCGQRVAKQVIASAKRQ